MAKIFFLNPSFVVDEFAGLLAPHPLTSFVFRCKGPLDQFFYRKQRNTLVLRPGM